MKVHLISENTVVVLSEQVISQDNLKRIILLQKWVKKNLNAYLIDMVSSYASLHITFNLLKISAEIFLEKLNDAVQRFNSNDEWQITPKLIEVPVYYGKDVALDIHDVAVNTDLTVDEVIDIHSNNVYQVYAIGFAPGFAFLGSVDKRIAVPRKTTPRAKVPWGSLGIADYQTAIYPSDSPGGWQIIGRTPIKLVNFKQQPITPLSIGDRVKFFPISAKEFKRLGGEF